MSKLYERVLVDAPLTQGRGRVVEYLRRQAAGPGDAAVLKLHLSVPIPAPVNPVTIEKDVLATFSPESDAGMDPRYGISWKPSAGGPFPIFSGTFTIEGAEDYDQFWLVLSGTYDPPIGLFGDFFDAIAGRFIARATARNLLEQIRSAVETAYGIDETAKAGRRAAQTVA